MAELYIGLMSGTSLDGADAVLADFSTPSPEVLAHVHAPFAASLREQLMNLQQAGNDELNRAALAGNVLVDHYAALVAHLLKQGMIDRHAVAAIGVHGQTVRHRPELGYTLQLNAPARLAEATGIDVIADFRSRDVAAGGHGAPLVPAFHSALFSDPVKHRTVVNIGGIANLTDLPPASSAASTVRGWDCGPGNVLLDGWVARHAGSMFDENGSWAATGRVDVQLLSGFQEEAWFRLKPPRSTGRDLFNAGWLQDHLAKFPALAARDVQATLSELSAWGISDSIEQFASGDGLPDEILVCGGGAHNADLLARLSRRLDQKLGRAIPVRTTADLGVPVDQIEALAFAWLARRFKLDLPGNLPAVSGAKGSRILGALYPAG